MKHNFVIKNALLILLIYVFAFALTACGQNSTSTPKPMEDSPASKKTGLSNLDQSFDSNSLQSEVNAMSGTNIDMNITDFEEVIADQYNSVFEGKIGTQNIRISIYRDGEVLTASYITQNDEDNEIYLQGTIQINAASFVLSSKDGATFLGTIKPETQEGTLLEGTYTYASSGEDSTFVLALSHTIGNTYDTRYPIINANTKEIEEFAYKIKLYVTENNKIGLAELISYPINVNISGSKVAINDKKEFEEKYDDIINDELKDKIMNCYTKYLFSNYMGVMLGNGEVWFDFINNNELQIYAINN